VVHGMQYRNPLFSLAAHQHHHLSVPLADPVASLPYSPDQALVPLTSYHTYRPHCCVVASSQPMLSTLHASHCLPLPALTTPDAAAGPAAPRTMQSTAGWNNDHCARCQWA
jgi:hypothetical protein